MNGNCRKSGIKTRSKKRKKKEKKKTFETPTTYVYLSIYKVTYLL